MTKSGFGFAAACLEGITEFLGVLAAYLESIRGESGVYLRRVLGVPTACFRELHGVQRAFGGTCSLFWGSSQRVSVVPRSIFPDYPQQSYGASLLGKSDQISAMAVVFGVPCCRFSSSSGLGGTRGGKLGNRRRQHVSEVCLTGSKGRGGGRQYVGSARFFFGVGGGGGGVVFEDHLRSD